MLVGKLNPKVVFSQYGIIRLALSLRYVRLFCAYSVTCIALLVTVACTELSRDIKNTVYDSAKT